MNPNLRTPLRVSLGVLLVAFGMTTAVAAATLKVSSFPSGAQVVVDGANTGKVTPMNVSLPEGDHVVTVQIAGAGWRPDTRTVTIGPGNNDLSVTLLPFVMQGAAGPKGDKGEPGAPGTNGANGTNGTNGTDGLNGTSGTDGRNGVDGQPGTPGAQGEPGPQGPAGVVGSFDSLAGLPCTRSGIAGAIQIFYAVNGDATLRCVLPDPTVPPPPPDDNLTPAVLSFNEVNPSIVGGLDLIELVVVQPGNTANITIQQNFTNPVVLATLPNIQLAAGERILVHLNPGADLISETTTTYESVCGGCVTSAWDVRGNPAGIASSSVVLLVRAPNGIVQEGVPFTNGGPTTSASFPSDVQSLQALGLWVPADCGGLPCAASTTPSVLDVSVNWGGLDVSGLRSVGRSPDGAQTHSKSDWRISSSSFGFPNF